MDMSFKLIDGTTITEHHVYFIKETEDGIELSSDESVRLVLIRQSDGRYSIATESIFR